MIKIGGYSARHVRCSSLPISRVALLEKERLNKIQKTKYQLRRFLSILQFNDIYPRLIIQYVLLKQNSIQWFTKRIIFTFGLLKATCLYACSK